MKCKCCEDRKKNIKHLGKTLGAVYYILMYIIMLVAGLLTFLTGFMVAGFGKVLVNPLLILLGASTILTSFSMIILCGYGYVKVFVDLSKECKK